MGDKIPHGVSYLRCGQGFCPSGGNTTDRHCMTPIIRTWTENDYTALDRASNGKHYRQPLARLSHKCSIIIKDRSDNVNRMADGRYVTVVVNCMDEAMWHNPLPQAGFERY